MNILIYICIYTQVLGYKAYINKSIILHTNLEKYIVYILSTGGDTKVITPG